MTHTVYVFVYSGLEYFYILNIDDRYQKLVDCCLEPASVDIDCDLEH